MVDNCNGHPTGAMFAAQVCGQTHWTPTTMVGSHSCKALILAVALAGCAAAEPGFSPSSGKPSKFKVLLSGEGGSMSSDGRYILSDHEQTLDCKKIGGIIHVGILQLREAGQRHRPSIAAKAAKTAVSPVIAGSSHGMDPDADHARALARAEALNVRLAEKGCAMFDLKAELAPGNTSSPAPVKAGKAR